MGGWPAGWLAGWVAGRARCDEMRRSAQRQSMRPAQNPLRRQIPTARTPAPPANNPPQTLPIGFSAANDSPSCPAPIAQPNAAQHIPAFIYFSSPSEHITHTAFCTDSLLRAQKKTLTLSASAFFFSSLCPPSAAFFFTLKICWFIRVGGTSDMVAFLFSGKMPREMVAEISTFWGFPGFLGVFVRPSGRRR